MSAQWDNEWSVSEPREPRQQADIQAKVRDIKPEIVMDVHYEDSALRQKVIGLSRSTTN